MSFKRKRPQMTGGSPHTAQNRGRIIVRNLPFAGLSEEAVKKIFEPHGEIIEVTLLKKDNGKFVGCGFVEFEKSFDAGKAIAKCNGVQMNGRPLVVDWALPRDQYAQKVSGEGVNAENEHEDDKTGILDEDSEEEEPDISEIKEEEGSDGEGEAEESEDDEDDEDEFEPDEEESDHESIASKRPESRDVDEGRTVFLRNVAFSATNNDLKKSVEVYGPVYYALICVDKMTEHSKGTAFVKFKDKASADKCLSDKNLVINGQPVEATLAVTRSKIQEERNKQKMKSKDSRNLYLVREGVVMAGSPAAESVSPADMAKRLQIEQWKTQILRNLNMFVSRTRLAIHNLPPDYDDNKIRAMVQQYSRSNAVIKEAKVMHNRKKYDTQGNALSKEIAFVSFGTHEEALHFLRQVNNNPLVFTPVKRPIVSFSIENREILTLKTKRLEKSRAKVLGDKAKDKTVLKMNKKQRRFLRRKEKIIKARQEAKEKKRLNGGIDSEKTNKTSKSKSTHTEETPADRQNSKGKSKSRNSNSEGTTRDNQSPTKKKRKNTNKSNPDKPTNSSTKNAVKRKQNPQEAPPSKVQKIENFIGAEAQPGKKMKIRSRQKLSQQVELFRSKQKEIKSVRKQQQVLKEKLKRRKEKNENKVQKGKRETKIADKLEGMVSKYKSSIENSETFKKWQS